MPSLPQEPVRLAAFEALLIHESVISSSSMFVARSWANSGVRRAQRNCRGSPVAGPIGRGARATGARCRCHELVYRDVDRWTVPIGLDFDRYRGLPGGGFEYRVLGCSEVQMHFKGNYIRSYESVRIRDCSTTPGDSIDRRVAVGRRGPPSHGTTNPDHIPARHPDQQAAPRARDRNLPVARPNDAALHALTATRFLPRLCLMGCGHLGARVCGTGPPDVLCRSVATGRLHSPSPAHDPAERVTFPHALPRTTRRSLGTKRPPR